MKAFALILSTSALVFVPLQVTAALMFSMGYSASQIEGALGEGQTATLVHPPHNCTGCGGGILDVFKVAPLSIVSAASITGTTKSGSRLYAKSIWAGSPETLKYQWYRGSNQNEANAIPNATSSSYVLTRYDVSHQISVKINATKTILKLASTETDTLTQTSFSSLTGKIVPPKVAVSGTMKRGKYVTWGSSSLKAKWPPSSGYKYSYQWYNNGKRIASKYGGKKYRYKLRSSDRGDKIKVKVTITKSDGTFTYSSTSSQRRVAR